MLKNDQSSELPAKAILQDPEGRSAGLLTFETIFEASPEPQIIVRPPDWTIVSANRARLEVTATTLKDQVGRKLFEVFPDDPSDPGADGVAKLDASLRRVVETRAPDVMALQRYPLRDQDGVFQERWWSPVNTPVLDHAGDVALIIHQVQDVTEIVRLRGEALARDELHKEQNQSIERLLRSEAALRTSEEFNRRILASSADCVKVLDLNGRLEFMSDGAMCVMEVDSFSDISGKPWPDLWPEGERDKVIAAVAAARSGEPARFQGQANTMKGDPRWWDVIVTAMDGLDGRPDKLLAISRDVTGAKQAEEARQRTEAEFRNMADAIPQIVWVTDAEGRAGYFNRQWYEYTGSSSQPSSAEQVGDDWIHEDDVAATLAAFDDARRLGSTFTVEHRIRSATGEYRWFLVRGEPQKDVASGNVIRIFGSSTDIHDRKLMEAALRESEERLRFFGKLEDQLFRSVTASDAMSAAAMMLGSELQASRCAYADVDADTDRFWIRNDYSASGVESSAGAYSLDLFGPRAAADMRAGRTLIVHDVARELAPGEGREMFEAIGIQAIVCCPLIKNGSLAAMMAVHQVQPRDWSAAEIMLIREVVERCWSHVERVGSEARLRESEERLRLAVDNADVGFWDLDIIADHLIWPARTKGMFGISPEVPVTMQDFYDGLHPDDAAATAAAFSAAADPYVRALYDVEYRTIGKEDGVVRWVAAKGRGVFDAHGRCLRVAGTAVEITARKRAQEALRDLNATLEARVVTAIREREEAQSALRQSQKMEAMGQLTGGVAHDFNNLLTPIVGVLDMLQRQKLGGEREQRLVAGAMQSAERAKTLVQRLLAFARRQPLQRVSVDVVQLVQTMGGLIESTTGPQIDVVVDASNKLPPANADANQLEMALLNLAVNARDAMPEGGTLRISAREAYAEEGNDLGVTPGAYIRLSVADTGAGMDKRTLARAVEPFFSTKGVGKGTGLGLSMVHGLAEQLGGTLKINSRVGVGTNVELWLPLSDSGPAVERSDSQQPSHAVRASGRVLLVDDEELARLSTADMLSGMGYEVVEVCNGEEALQAFQNGANFDLVVTDHLMPGITGTDLVRAVRLTQPSMPALVISGYADVEGIDADVPRLTKPFRRSDLETSIASLVGNQHKA